MRKTLIIFANSAKHGQHCIAGKCIDTGEWIRPVGDVAGKALADNQVRHENIYGTYFVKPLQKIEMVFEKHAPCSTNQKIMSFLMMCGNKNTR